MGFAQKMQRCHEYVEALEEEKRKIQVFQRELPLCLELVTQAIETCKKELSGTTTEYMQGQSECSEEQTSSDAPVLEEFIPLKRTCSSEDNDEEHSHKPTTTINSNNSTDKKKSDWLRSVQLWNQSPDPPSKEDVPRKTAVVEVKRNGGAFQPFHREKSVGKTDNHQSVAKPNLAAVPAAATSSTTETVSKGSAGNSKKEDKEGQSGQRKQRRCWSPELHRRFLHALQQLGGSHAATPKQIRELMKVDGLTNDEVKSHLQKYRLHTRRPSPAIHNNTNPRAPQFVVVGGIWVPPPEYAAVSAKASGEAASIGGANGIYAPLAAPRPTTPHSPPALMQRSQSKHMQSEEGGSHSEGGRHSSSPSTSSSTHTTTTSPAL